MKKKLVTAILLASMTLSLAACGDNTKPVESPTDVTTQTETNTESTTEITETKEDKTVVSDIKQLTAQELVNNLTYMYYEQNGKDRDSIKDLLSYASLTTDDEDFLEYGNLQASMSKDYRSYPGVYAQWKLNYNDDTLPEHEAKAKYNLSYEYWLKNNAESLALVDEVKQLLADSGFIIKKEETAFGADITTYFLSGYGVEYDDVYQLTGYETYETYGSGYDDNGSTGSYHGFSVGSDIKIFVTNDEISFSSNIYDTLLPSQDYGNIDYYKLLDYVPSDWVVTASLSANEYMVFHNTIPTTGTGFVVNSEYEEITNNYSFTVNNGDKTYTYNLGNTNIDEFLGIPNFYSDNNDSFKEATSQGNMKLEKVSILGKTTDVYINADTSEVVCVASDLSRKENPNMNFFTDLGTPALCQFVFTKDEYSYYWKVGDYIIRATYKIKDATLVQFINIENDFIKPDSLRIYHKSFIVGDDAYTDLNPDMVEQLVPLFD